MVSGSIISAYNYNNMTNFRKKTTNIDDRTLEEIPFDELRRYSYRADVFDLNSLPTSSCPWHWHNDVEFFYMEKSSLICRTTNRVCRFEEGDAGFINADVLHMTEAAGYPPSIQQYHIFQPRLLASPLNITIETKYIEPLTNNYSSEMLRFPAHSSTAEAMRGCMDQAFLLYTQKPFGFEILLRNVLSELWLILLNNMPQVPEDHESHDLERVRAMVHFIETNYSKRITLDDIVRAAHIGKSEGIRCFKRMLRMTPFTLLISYRIDRAREMLAQSEETVTNISLNCGFPSLNYFGKVFREKTALSPSEYRAKFMKKN
jgi:AraC-like DNA-binding protein